MRSRTLAACGLALFAAGCAVEPMPPHRPPPREPVRSHRPAPPPPTSDAPLPPAPADEKDRHPSPDEIPPDVGSIPDAVPEPVERSRYGNPESYEVLGKRYVVLADGRGFKQRGHASWYGKKFHGRRTSSGEKYDMFQMTAAHKTLPIPTYARVTNLENGRSVVVRVNDRGPFHHGRIVDLSYTAAHKLDLIKHGSAEVELEVVDARGQPLSPSNATTVAASTEPTPAPPPPPSAVRGPPRFLQAGVFNDTSNALTFRDRLMVSGIRPLAIKSAQRGGKWVYRVLVGPFDDPARLSDMRTRLHAEDTQTILVHE
jgi:rare lipoprotein A